MVNAVGIRLPVAPNLRPLRDVFKQRRPNLWKRRKFAGGRWNDSGRRRQNKGAGRKRERTLVPSGNQARIELRAEGRHASDPRWTVWRLEDVRLKCAARAGWIGQKTLGPLTINIEAASGAGEIVQRSDSAIDTSDAGDSLAPDRSMEQHNHRREEENPFHRMPFRDNQ